MTATGPLGEPPAPLERDPEGRPGCRVTVYLKPPPEAEAVGGRDSFKG